MLSMTSIHLKLLKLVLCPPIRSVLENESCTLKRLWILLLLGEKFSICQAKLGDRDIQVSHILITFFF